MQNSIKKEIDGLRIIRIQQKERLNLKKLETNI